ncbi:MAG: hypothetical protein JNM07_01945 [Phycisphaerae bacterium]|nr:hypothetical protein [Phycisphaerae bacterium]
MSMLGPIPGQAVQGVTERAAPLSGRAAAKLRRELKASEHTSGEADHYEASIEAVEGEGAVQNGPKDPGADNDGRAPGKKRARSEARLGPTASGAPPVRRLDLRA